MDADRLNRRERWGKKKKRTLSALCRCVCVECWCRRPRQVYFLRGWARRWRCLCLDPEESLEPEETEEEIIIVCSTLRWQKRERDSSQIHSETWSVSWQMINRTILQYCTTNNTTSTKYQLKGTVHRDMTTYFPSYLQGFLPITFALVWAL